MLPITFQPHYMQRIWGGRALETHFERTLPDEEPYGESWELTDRPEAQSVVSTGEHKGKTLHQLWTAERSTIFGDYPGYAAECPFPLLIKILDCHDDLSLQVHPPSTLCPKLGGEPKTEMWYILGTEPEAKLYVGLKSGTTQATFEKAIETGTCQDHIHSITPEIGQSIHIPSGRLHAIGGGNLIIEIQQNSDTTYRVYDWDRPGFDGTPRELHLEESLQCIDFDDHEPPMDSPCPTAPHALACCEHYHVDHRELQEGTSIGNPLPHHFSILTVLSGELTDHAGYNHPKGSFLLLPKHAHPLTATQTTEILQTTLPTR